MSATRNASSNPSTHPPSTYVPRGPALSACAGVRRKKAGLAIALALVFTGCGSPPPPEHVSPVMAEPIVPKGSLAEDATQKESLRLVPPEVYMRTYLELFGGLSPLDAQKRGRGADGGNLFDTWDDYIASLGFPDYHLDIPRQTQTNALMVATFERIGVALCDRAVEHDLKGKTPPPVSARVIFAFEMPRGPLEETDFVPRYDVLHRTFLGYPSKLAPKDREARFFALYKDISDEHTKGLKAGQKSRFTSDEEGWAAVCYAFIRHPEFHLY